LLIGRSGCGKTSLIQSLHKEALAYRKTQAAEYYQDFIDVPGEYLEVRSFYRALIMLMCEACAVALLQAADDAHNLYPSGLARTFSKPVIGIVTKADVAEDADAGVAADVAAGSGQSGADRAESAANGRKSGIDMAAAVLREAGAPRVFVTSAVSGLGIDELGRCLDGLRNNTLQS